MQIVEKSGEGLSRVYGVTVPMADLNSKLEARIAEVTPRAISDRARLANCPGKPLCTKRTVGVVNRNPWCG